MLSSAGAKACSPCFDPACMLVQEAARSSSGGFQAPGMGRVEYSSGSASHVPDRAHSSNSDSSSTARPSHNGGPANESTSCLAKGPTSLMDPSCADMQGSMHQRQSVKPSANSYAGVTRNLSSDGLAAGEQLRLCPQHPPQSPAISYTSAGSAIISSFPPFPLLMSEHLRLHSHVGQYSRKGADGGRYAGIGCLNTSPDR